MRHLVSFFFFFLFLAQAFASAPLCSAIYPQPVQLDRFSQVVQKIQNGKKQDTTSLRQEVKYVVETTDLNQQLHRLQQYFGKAMKNRDKAPDGILNITSTLYLTVAKYKTVKGEEKSAKVRFRKYFTRKEIDVFWRDLKVSEDLADKSWLELKIQHPEFPNVVNKPRLLCYDKDIRNFTTDSFFLHKEQIRKRLEFLNPGKAEEVDNALEFMTELYANPARRVQNLYAKTEYERVSYSIKMKNSKNPEEAIDVQITLDENVRLTRLADNRSFNVYAPSETVIEVKIPVAYSKLSPEDIELFPGLAEIKSLNGWLQENHKMKYPMNKGKMSKIEKKNVDPDKDNKENTAQYLNVLDELD